MATGVVEAIYNILLSIKNAAKRLRTRGKHMKFCSDGSVATLFLRCSFICNELCFIHLVHYHIFGRIINLNVLVETLQ